MEKVAEPVAKFHLDVKDDNDNNDDDDSSSSSLMLLLESLEVSFFQSTQGSPTLKVLCEPMEDVAKQDDDDVIVLKVMLLNDDDSSSSSRKKSKNGGGVLLAQGIFKFSYA